MSNDVHSNYNVVIIINVKLISLTNDDQFNEYDIDVTMFFDNYNEWQWLMCVQLVHHTFPIIYIFINITYVCVPYSLNFLRVNVFHC